MVWCVYQVLGERVLVGIALRVETGARVTIPVPGAADIAAGLEHPCREAELAEFIESIQARHAGTDYDSIIVLGHDCNPPWLAVSLYFRRVIVRCCGSAGHDQAASLG